ncbi:beta-ketoacyl-ACP synthase [Suttonella ornithocola]|uniref:3-oxoacyl-[acyl-carrier-protein] synthase 2 n=1 Tax=Suttonella ornithocola TaxID=279832 RepID=A0A380MZV9_9GAMM|nr:beta-ketoacyl-ACP synthase [Suttonella ornithocola]SUO97211.1 3-oxoacyl-[acyl-carrier-protein] synthase 2 [Suttonella ornithocola]
MLKRVVVTGMGGVTAFGNSWQSIREKMLRYENAVIAMPEWDRHVSLETRLAAPILDYQPPEYWTRKQLRSLGRVSQFCVEAAEHALEMAGLLNHPEMDIKDGRLGVASGSSTGSTPDILAMAELISQGDSHNFNANTYIRMMPHTTAANVAIFYGLTGRIIPTSCACASATQAIGYSFEAIRYGQIDMMLAGGGEELCVSESYVFDALYATSRKNQAPKATPAPYDTDRDGLVIGEGGAFLVLESLESALARGATIYAEIVGYGSNADGTHVTRPEAATMEKCMALALKSAQLKPEQIAYVNGHGTATEQGDIAETQATAALMPNVPISSQKSYFGHTLGACGSMEAWFSIEMMRESLFMPTINLHEVDSRCGKLDYIQESARAINADYVMSNNFAFGGVNASLIFKRWES